MISPVPCAAEYTNLRRLPAPAWMPWLVPLSTAAILTLLTPCAAFVTSAPANLFVGSTYEKVAASGLSIIVISKPYIGWLLVTSRFSVIVPGEVIVDSKG